MLNSLYLKTLNGFAKKEDNLQYLLKKKLEKVICVPKKLFFFLQSVEHVDRCGLLQAVGLKCWKHVDKLQEDFSNAHSLQVLIALYEDRKCIIVNNKSYYNIINQSNDRRCGFFNADIRRAQCKFATIFKQTV